MNDIRRKTEDVLSELVRLACQLGASAAKAIAAEDIAVEDDLAQLCAEPRCENFGQSLSCPPHVSGPSGFRELLERFNHAVVFKIEVPTKILLSDQRREVFRLLHKVAAKLEKAAIDMGCSEASAYAGGSCKQIFCTDQASCRVLADNDDCCHPHHARPSMSGFGINVARLMQAAGWSLERITAGTDPVAVPLGNLSGLVLVC